MRASKLEDLDEIDLKIIKNLKERLWRASDLAKLCGITEGKLKLKLIKIESFYPVYEEHTGSGNNRHLYYKILEEGDLKMNRFEELEKKMNNCREMALKTKGKMKRIWTNHYYAIMETIATSTVEELSQKVE